MIKTPNSALGARRNCPNFDPCPLCFGCRSYDSAVVKCGLCYEEDRKANICNRELHTEKALAVMLQMKNKTYIKEKKD